MVASVDCHKSQHTIAFKTEVGAMVRTMTIAAEIAGYEGALSYARSLGETAWALEGTGSYGLAFAQFLDNTRCQRVRRTPVASQSVITVRQAAG